MLTGYWTVCESIGVHYPDRKLRYHGNYALSEEVEFKGGDVITNNFDTYQLPLFSWVPETIDTVILDRRDQVPQRGGEPAIICMGGTLANAIFDACWGRGNPMR